MGIRVYHCDVSHIGGSFHHYEMSNSVSGNIFCLKSLFSLLLLWPRQHTPAAELSGIILCPFSRSGSMATPEVHPLPKKYS